jgi:hypothetical protein
LFINLRRVSGGLNLVKTPPAASATVEPTTTSSARIEFQPSLMRREMNRIAYPALKRTAKFKPPLHGEESKGH